MATYKSAIKQTREIRELVRRAGAALETVLQDLPEQERQAGAQVVRATARAEIPADKPAMPRGNYAHQERLLGQPATEAAREELLDALTWHGPIAVARVALAQDLPGVRAWAASTVALGVFSALSSVLSAQFILGCCEDGGWGPEDSKTWWPMAHNARVQAEVAVEMVELLRG